MEFYTESILPLFPYSLGTDFSAGKFAIDAVIHIVVCFLKNWQIDCVCGNLASQIFSSEVFILFSCINQHYFEECLFVDFTKLIFCEKKIGNNSNMNEVNYRKTTANITLKQMTIQCLVACFPW